MATACKSIKETQLPAYSASIKIYSGITLFPCNSAALVGSTIHCSLGVTYIVYCTDYTRYITWRSSCITTQHTIILSVNRRLNEAWIHAHHVSVCKQQQTIHAAVMAERQQNNGEEKGDCPTTSQMSEPYLAHRWIRQTESIWVQHQRVSTSHVVTQNIHLSLENVHDLIGLFNSAQLNSCFQLRITLLMSGSLPLCAVKLDLECSY